MAAKKNIQLTVEFTDDGKAIIRIPHGKTQQLNAAELAAMTDELSKALGTVEERHIGDHDHHHHDHSHNNNTNTNNA